MNHLPFDSNVLQRWVDGLLSGWVAGDEPASPRNKLHSMYDREICSGGSPSLHPGHPHKSDGCDYLCATTR